MGAKLKVLDRAINEESWEWLGDNIPTLANAVQDAVNGGASPDDIKRHMVMRTQRHALAMRCYQAACYLADR